MDKPARVRAGNLQPVSDDRRCCYCGNVIPQAHYARFLKHKGNTCWFHAGCPRLFKAYRP